MTCLNSVAPPPLNWKMWCPGKDAKVMQWVDKHGALHRQITIRPQQNMTTTMAIWFLSTYLTGMLPPVVEFQGGVSSVTLWQVYYIVFHFVFELSGGFYTQPVVQGPAGSVVMGCLVLWDGCSICPLQEISQPFNQLYTD